MKQTANENGSAIIIVLGSLALLTLLVLHLSVGSEVTAREAKVQAVRSELKYAAESAAERACWLWLCDRRAHPNRTLGTTADTPTTQPEERWRTDGVVHAFLINGMNAKVSMGDADAGIDISGTRPDESLRPYLLTDTETDTNDTMEIQRFMDVLRDYIDSGDADATRLNGKEQPDYEAQGYPWLPRNAQLRFREEILWLDGIEFLAPLRAPDGNSSNIENMVAAFRIIPPPGTAFPRRSRPNFFSTPDALIQNLGVFTDSEISQILAARQQFATEPNLDLATTLDPRLLTRLRQQFSFAESGIVTIEVQTQSPDGTGVRKLRLTRDMRGLKHNINGYEVVQNWEKLFL